jgi:hypothetical protein
MAKFSETPLMELILRRYESPHNLSKRDTLKKICLSLGLLQPGDSRDVIVDILMVLENQKPKKKEISAIKIKEEVLKNRKKYNLSDGGCADSNVRRQLKRLRDIYLVEKIRNEYRIYEFMDLKEIFTQKIRPIILEAILIRNNEFFNFYNENYEQTFKKENKEKIIREEKKKK